MKKVIALLFLLLMLFTPVIGVNAFNGKDPPPPPPPKREIPILENGAINESSSFANIVIFIKFADETSYSAPYDYDHYEGLFNSLTTASLKSYYLEVSYNQLTIESYIVNDGTTMIYFQDIYDRNHYELYDVSTNPDGYGGTSGITQKEREHDLLNRAINYVEDNNLVSDAINLDVNGDGDVDSITFMVSGEDDGWNNLLWPHKWSLSSYYNYTTGEYYPDAPLINGLHAYKYTFELLGNSAGYDNIVDVGVLAHETFHLISAPDLYHYYRYDNIEPVGDWGLMDGTTEIPSHMLGYMKEKYGNWIPTVDQITESGTYTLAPLSDSGDNLYKIDLGYSNEYIYIEYRAQSGDFEINLPNTGLIAYRVDLDYFDDGNVDGYYDTAGDPRDELFVFRPGISTNPLPIIFPSIDDENVDEDGDIENAAISNNNLYTEMGNNTDIPMFYSDGTLIDILIYNVLEHDGVITFDVYIPPRIDLVSELEIPEGTDLYLYSGDGFEYRLDITNVPSNANIYYTQDGTIPTPSDTLYAGEIITFDETTSVIKAVVYIDGILVSNLYKEFNFVTEIETDHNPYGDYQDITWYLDLEDDLSNYNLSFFSDSYLEDTYDFVYITNSTETLDYTGNGLSNLELTYSEDILIQFESDQTEDDFYGFYVEVDLLIDLQLNVLGDTTIEIEVLSDYTDLGAEMTGDSAHLYTLVTIGSVDTSILGEYVLTYNVLDANLDIIRTESITVRVVDTTAPEIIMNGDETVTVEVFDAYTDPGVTYSDNLDTVLDYDYVNTVDTNRVGSFVIVYTVTDLSGNVTTVIRTVNVVDTVAPTVRLLPGVDTVYVGEEHILRSIECSDNYYQSCTIEVEGSIDRDVAGIYIIKYTATEKAGNSVVVYRYVNVIERKFSSSVIFALGKTLNTIKVGEEFTPASCSLGGEFADYEYTCNVDTSDVNTNTPGTYEILYNVEIDDVTYTKVSYVFVYDPDDTIVWYYDKSRRDYL